MVLDCPPYLNTPKDAKNGRKGRNEDPSAESVQVLEGLQLIFQAEVLPSLQGDGDVAVEPEEVMKGTEAEGAFLLAVRIGEKFVDLHFADLVGDGLTGIRGEQRRLSVGGAGIHGDVGFEVSGGLVESEFTESEFNVNFHTQCAE